MREYLTRTGDQRPAIGLRLSQPERTNLAGPAPADPSNRLAALIPLALSDEGALSQERMSAAGSWWDAGSILQLQRSCGNRFVQRALARGSHSDGRADVAPKAESAIERARGGGQELDHGARRQMESVFGADFSGVRIHTGPEAHELNREVSAVAFTTGQDIFFRDGAYNPGTSGGKELLAHELTHVVQQGGAPVVSGKAQRDEVQRMCPKCEEEEVAAPIQGKLEIGQQDDEKEQEANRIARAVVSESANDVAQDDELQSDDKTAQRQSSSDSELDHRDGVSHARLQRTIGDGHDLQAPRFSGNAQLEAVFDGELSIQVNSHGVAVQLIQQSLLDQGYTLLAGGADGIFGPETKAAIIRFQTDAHAFKVDGIVGPETMGLLDQHDTTLLTGVGPVATTGPLPGPRPAPAAGCDAPYTGVTFTLANQLGSGVSPGSNIRIVSVGGRDFFQFGQLAHANYAPDVTINAPSDVKAQEFQVGFASNLLSETLVYTFSNGSTITSTLPTPTKDGRAMASGLYDPIYVEQPTPGVLENFTAAGSTVHLNWPDVPSDGAFVNLTDNPECAGPRAPATMTNALFNDTFRTWVAVRHPASGCVRALHHIDWALNWSATVATGGAISAATVGTNNITVSVANGDGSPRFIQGGQVPDDLLAANRVCA